MPQTSNSLLTPTKSMVARGNQWSLRTNRPPTETCREHPQRHMGAAHTMCAWGVHAQCMCGGTCVMHTWGGVCAMHTWGYTQCMCGGCMCNDACMGVHAQCVCGGARTRCNTWKVCGGVCIILCPWLPLVAPSND